MQHVSESTATILLYALGMVIVQMLTHALVPLVTLVLNVKSQLALVLMQLLAHALITVTVPLTTSVYAQLDGLIPFAPFQSALAFQEICQQHVVDMVTVLDQIIVPVIMDILETIVQKLSAMVSTQQTLLFVLRMVVVSPPTIALAHPGMALPIALFLFVTRFWRTIQACVLVKVIVLGQTIVSVVLNTPAPVVQIQFATISLKTKLVFVQITAFVRRQILVFAHKVGPIPHAMFQFVAVLMLQ